MKLRDLLLLARERKARDGGSLKFTFGVNRESFRLLYKHIFYPSVYFAPSPNGSRIKISEIYRERRKREKKKKKIMVD